MAQNQLHNELRFKQTFAIIYCYFILGKIQQNVGQQPLATTFSVTSSEILCKYMLPKYSLSQTVLGFTWHFFE